MIFSARSCGDTSGRPVRPCSGSRTRIDGRWRSGRISTRLRDAGSEAYDHTSKRATRTSAASGATRAERAGEAAREKRVGKAEGRSPLGLKTPPDREVQAVDNRRLAGGEHRRQTIADVAHPLAVRQPDT